MRSSRFCFNIFLEYNYDDNKTFEVLDSSYAGVGIFNTGSVQYDNILTKGCVLTSTTYSSLTAAMAAANTASCLGGAAANNPIGSPGTGPATTKAVVYWTVQKNTNEILEPGEHANLVLVYANAERPGASQDVKAELILDSGAPVEFQRTMPPMVDKFTNMG